MPAISENLVFIRYQDGATSYTTSTVSITYPNTATNALVYITDKIKGDGYFGGSDGLHTVFWNLSDFLGNVNVQGSLSSEPQDTDWVNIKLTPGGTPYTVDTTGLITIAGVETVSYNTATTTVKSYNFTGNFVWLRGKVSNFTQGTVNVISINR